VSWNWKGEIEQMIPEGFSKSQIEQLITEWIVGRNAERDREILRRRLFDGVTFERLSEEFDLSVRQTKNIVYKGEHRIFSHIKTA
jgi:hypothetical protein